MASVQKIAEGAVFTFPEKIGHSSFWHNSLVKRNNRVLTPANFPGISGLVSTISDFFRPCSNEIMNKNEFCNMYNVDVTEDDYIEIRFIINLAFQKLKLRSTRVLPAVKPFKPLLIDIALSAKRGCSLYYKLIRKSKDMSNNMVIREQKWHMELNQTFSISFWEKARQLCASINFENPLKWLQFQVHFIRNVNPECYYCQFTS